MKYDIFISYRREGGYETAKHLYDLLTRDGYSVSFDIDTLRSGDFDIYLLSRIDECTDFILVLDAHAFERTIDPKFPKEKDWLYQELSYALKQNKNIIPVMLPGFYFPANLPDDIVKVQRKNGPKYDKYYFDEFYNKLKNIFLNTPTPKVNDSGAHRAGKQYLQTDSIPEKKSSPALIAAIVSLCLCALTLGGFVLYNMMTQQSSSADNSVVNIDTKSSGLDNDAAVHEYDSTAFIWLAQRYANESDIKGKTSVEIRIMRNSVFARHGRNFQDPLLREFFKSKAWYKPYRDEIPVQELNGFEKKNIEYLKNHE